MLTDPFFFVFQHHQSGGKKRLKSRRKQKQRGKKKKIGVSVSQSHRHLIKLLTVTLIKFFICAVLPRGGGVGVGRCDVVLARIFIVRRRRCSGGAGRDSHVSADLDCGQLDHLCLFPLKALLNAVRCRFRNPPSG